MNPLPAIGSALSSAAQFIMRFCKWTTPFFWMGVGCYALAGWLFWCFLIVDASFIRPLAPASINEDTFQHVAWGYRVFGLICIAMTVALFAAKKWLWGGITLLLAVVCSVILFGHAIGLSFKSMEEQYAAGAVVSTVENVSVEEINAQIADIDQRRKDIRDDKTAEVNRLQSSIDGIVNDGLDNDDEAQGFRDDQTKAENAAKEALAKLDAQRSDLVAKRQEARTGAATQAVEQRSFNPFFVGLARFQTGQWKPGEPVDETSSYTSGLGFFGIFFAFGELLMMLMPGAGSTFLLMHGQRRNNGVTESLSEDVPPGKVRVEMTDDEWAEYQRAMDVHKNIKTGARKGATTRRRGNKIEAANDYYRERIAEWMEAHNRGQSTVSIAESAGLSVAQMRLTYGPHMTEEEHAALFFSGVMDTPDILPDPEPAPEPEPEPEIHNDPDADELDIPPEPLDYPVAPYTPPANDKPENEEAA